VSVTCVASEQLGCIHNAPWCGRVQPAGLCGLQVWIVLELCAGGTLKDAVASGRLSTNSKLELVSTVTGRML